MQKERYTWWHQSIHKEPLKGSKALEKCDGITFHIISQCNNFTYALTLKDTKVHI